MSFFGGPGIGNWLGFGVLKRIDMLFEGADGGAVFTDTGLAGSAWSRSGANVTTSTTAPLAGAASLLVNGSADYLETSADSLLLPPTADWIIRFRTYYSGAAGRVLMSVLDGALTAAGTQWMVYVGQALGAGDTPNRVFFFLSDGAAFTARLQSAVLNQLVTRDLEISRTANVLALKVDGVTVDSVAFASTIPQPAGRKWRIGNGESGLEPGAAYLKVDNFEFWK